MICLVTRAAHRAMVREPARPAHGREAGLHGGRKETGCVLP